MNKFGFGPAGCASVGAVGAAPQAAAAGRVFAWRPRPRRLRARLLVVQPGRVVRPAALLHRSGPPRGTLLSNLLFIFFNHSLIEWFLHA